MAIVQSGRISAVSDNHCHCLVVDEAHALGVFGSKGEGFVQMLVYKTVFLLVF
jgi:7-keto-8-aminopelargonate synthetase-like enzyme